MKRSLVLAAAALLLAAPPAFAGPGEVTAVSVLPAPGRAQVVIDVRGSVAVQDFTLASPARVVIDVTGATLATPNVVYDGVNRGGILNVRYAQFRPDVVRIVIELESLKDYRVEKVDGAVRVSLGSDHQFAAWSSLDPSTLAAATTTHADTSPTGSPYAYQPPPAPPVTARHAVSQQSQQPRITVTFDSAAIADVMQQFAGYSGRSIVLGKDVKGYVTAQITNQPWDVAFHAILEQQGLQAIQDPSGIIRVADRGQMAKQDSIEPLETKFVRVNYANAGGLVPSVKAVLSSRGQVVADTNTNGLIITDVASRIDQDSAFVSNLDVRTPQVSIHAKLIFVDRTDIQDLGVQYDLGTNSQFFNQLIQRPQPGTGTGGVPTYYDKSTNIVSFGGNALAAIGNAEATIASPALKMIFSTAIGNFFLTTFVQALQEVDLADLQAEPVISTADNTEAQIQVGERTPIRVIDVASGTGGGGGGGAVARATTTIVPTGIILRVTPHVTSNGQVLMKLHAENSSVQAAPTDIGFTFQTQNSDNQLLVNDGETAVIGGLTVTQVTVSKTGIPFLVDLPVVGKIFGFTTRREQRRDLLILVTPHIVDDAATSSN